MKSNYNTYKAEDFLQDDYFIHTALHPTDESVAYWQKLIEEGVIDKKEYEFARHYITEISVEKGLMSDIELRNLYKKIETDTVKKIHKKRIRFFYPAAASFLFVLLGSAYIYLAQLNKQDDIVTIAGTLEKVTASEHVELILSDNERISIMEDDATIDYAHHDGSIKINERTVNNETAEKKDEAVKQFNQLVVPHGKRSSLTLEDGTQIWVNAGTRVIYPITFEKDKREIYVDGEIYLKVSKDVKRPFHVKTSDMRIAVLGTSFNVMAYESDAVQSVVLVEGSVQVKSKESRKEHLMKPNSMFTKQNGDINIKPVRASDYISWIDGMYISDNEELTNILLRLSRYYNVKITADEYAGSLPCTGKLDLKEDIINVLNVLASTAPVDYRRDENGDYHFMFNPSK